jgi:ADP-ribose pyrophosphatase YjhB (NUDIX family)
MSHAGAELPLAGTMNVPNVDKELLNAHISVMTADDVEAIGANKINERGHSFKYALGHVKELTPGNIDGVSKIWAIQISSPELSALRKSYGLSALPKDEPFHITVAVRRKNVLRENDVSKFDTASGRGELKAAADAETTYECNCSGRCTCPPSCVCKKSCCAPEKSANEGAPWGTPADKLPWRERVEVYAHDPKGRIYGGIYNTDKSFAVPGGGIDPGEDPGQAALRELEEETGIKATNPRVLPIAPVDNAWSDKHRQEKQRNFAGSRTHFVAVDILQKLRRKNLDKWDADQRKMYDPTAAEQMMANHTNCMAPSVAAGRLAALRHIIANAAKKTAADLLPGGAADNVPDSKFPKKDLALGVKDEREHTSNDQIAKEIAKDHLQEDSAHYKKEELKSVRKTPQILLQLRAAKEHSDNKRYDQKNHILRQLISAAPQDWVVDDPKPYHMGITHSPTNFKFHADPKIIPPVVPVSKAASRNPYIAQLFATAPSVTPGNTTWQNVVQHLRNVKTRGDRQAFAEQNTQGLLAELDPEYKKKLHSQIASKNYPRPDFLTRMIQQHGDSALNAVS